MPGILWRIIIAVVGCVVAFALIPPVSRLIGLPIEGDMFLVIRLCIAGLAVFYIIKGTGPTWNG